MSKKEIIEESEGVFKTFKESVKKDRKFHQVPDRFIIRESFNPDDGDNEVRIPRKEDT